MTRQFTNTSLTRLAGPALALACGLATIGRLEGNKARTNDLIHWPARGTPEEIGRKTADYMLPRWQPAGPADPGVQDFMVLFQFAGKTADEASRSKLLERVDSLTRQFEENPGCLQRRADHSAFGAVWLEIHLQTGNPRYLTLGRRLADRQWENPGADGLSGESRFRVEDMHWITALQVRAFRSTGEPAYLDRAARTLSAYCDRLQDANGLFRHGVSAPFYWGRGNGFAGIALATLLTELPTTNAHHAGLLAAYQKLMTAVAQHQGPGGRWNQLIDTPNSYAETSATAMLTQGIAVGVGEGWLAPDRFTSSARRGWLSLLEKVGNSGKVYHVAVAAEPSSSSEYYLNLPVQRGGREGQIAVLQCALALIEVVPPRRSLSASRISNPPEAQSDWVAPDLQSTDWSQIVTVNREGEQVLRPFSDSFVFHGERAAKQCGPELEKQKAMKTQELENETVKQTVRERYGRIAEQGRSCGCAPTCCGPTGTATKDGHDAAAVSMRLGYSADETGAVPEGSNLGLGCGNPQAIAALRPGETVLDLGSGAGFDAFLAARSVGPTGRVIGVDMTPEMVSKARRNQAASGCANVEFRVGEIESLPVADATVDVIISNCVINLSPDKPRVFREAFRVLKPGGRVAVSDVVAFAPIPEALRRDWELYTGCVAGASLVDDLQVMLKQAGFTNIRIARRGASREMIGGWFPGRKAEDHVASASIEAVKPATR